MGPKTFFSLSLIMLISITVKAEDVMVQTLSQGACWYEQAELLKVVSFNDHESLSVERENIEYVVSDLLDSKTRTKSLFDLSLHCGGYGASFVVKTEYQGLPACVWLKLNKGQFEVRSLGGLEDNRKGDLCDGYKWGELVIGLKFREQKEIFHSEQLSGMVKSVNVISGLTFKLILSDEYRGRESEVMSFLKKKYDLKYVEYNLYQHPVGEAASLK